LRFVDRRTGETSFAPSYVGDETLLGSIWRTLSANAIAAEVNYGALQYAEGRDRRTWAADLRNEVNHLRTAQTAPAPLGH
jgi:1-acyl-sn-glycerol-3-phosphate acyltransferase